MQSLIIVSSPRVGSNLLMFSLAKHPQAKCAGEWFHPRADAFAAATGWPSRDSGTEFNLFKLHGHQQDIPGFWSLFNSGVTVHLSRRDKAAQMASWQRALRTGQWLGFEQDAQFLFPGEPLTPAEMESHIRDCDMLAPHCNLQLVYEEMIADWDNTIAKCLAAAGWETCLLPMALKPVPQ